LDKLGINLGFLLVYLLNFLIIFVVLRVWVYKPVVNLLDQRKDRIAKSLEDARVAEEARANAEAEAGKIIAAAQAERAKTVAEASERAHQAAAEIRKAADEEKARIIAQAREDAEQEKVRVLGDVRGQVVTLAMAAANKVIGASLDKQSQQSLIEELMTEDGKALVVRSYVAWRVKDPLALFRTLRRIDDVQSQLNNRLRDAQSILGRYTFEQLVSPLPDKSKLTEAEQLIRAKLVQDMKSPQDYGVEIVTVGIHRLELHKQVTPAVFNHMRKVRESLAQTARNEGNAKAQAIKSSAERDRDIIMAFANGYAENIRGEAIRNTAKYYEKLQQDEEFAIYLNQLEALKKTLQRNTTFILDTQTAPFDLFGKAEGEGTATENK